MANQIEIRISTPGGAESVRVVEQVRAAVSELQGASAAAGQGVGQSLGAINTAPMEVLERQIARVITGLTYLETSSAETAAALRGVAPAGAAEDVKKVGDAAEKSAKQVKQLHEELGRVGAGLQDVGGKLTVGVTAPLLAIGGAALKAGMDFEQAMVGVAKTTDLTAQELKGLGDELKRMSEMPGRPGAVELAGIAETAGQLGIAKENLKEFTEVISALRVSTNILGDEGAASLARFANITQMPQTEFERLGSTVVALGNSLATTEAEIMTMGLRLAGAGHQVGLTEAQIMGFAGALRSVGIEAEAGGTAISKVMIKIANAAASGGAELTRLAQVAGMSAGEFQRLFREDAAEATIRFVEGLRRLSDQGVNVFAVLKDVDFQEQRVRDALLRAAGAGDLLRESVQRGTDAWKDNTALTKEAEQFYGTANSQLKALWNTVTNVAQEFGAALIPAMREGVEVARTLLEPVRDLVKLFGDLPAPIRTFLAATGVGAAAIGPFLYATGGLAQSLNSIISLAPKARNAIAALKGAEALGGVASAAGAATAGVTATAGAAATLGTALAVGGTLLVGLGAVAGAYMLIQREARRAGEEMEEALRRAETAIPKMESEVLRERLKSTAEPAREMYAQLKEQAANLQRLESQGMNVEGRAGHGVYMAAKQRYDQDLAAYKNLLEQRKLAQAELDRRNQIPGFTWNIPGKRDIWGNAEADMRGTPGTSLGPLSQGADALIVLHERLEKNKKQAKELALELAVSGEVLKGLTPGTDAFKALNDKVRSTAEELKMVNRELQVLEGGFSRAAAGVMASLPDPEAAMLARRSLPEFRVDLRKKDASSPWKNQESLIRTAREMRLGPDDLSPELAAQLRQALAARRISEEEYLKSIKQGSTELSQAGAVAVSAFGTMVQAAITGTQQMEQVVIQGFASIAQAAVMKSNPILGTVIGAAGGILGSLFGRKREPTPVRLEEYSQRALSQQQRQEGPHTVILQMIDPGSGQVVAEQEYQLNRRSRRDGVTRIPHGMQLGGV